MKQTTTEVINRLTNEYNDLAGRIGSLERFLICEDFQKVSSNQRLMLAKQLECMRHYREILIDRLVDLRNQEKREALMEKELSATMCKCAEVEPEAESGTPAD